jgi:hypothetical protein
VTGPDQVIRPLGIPSAEAFGMPSLKTQELVTMQHLWTARYAARLCREREAQILHQRSLDIELRSHAMTSIFFVSAFEALISTK